ncbi:hypothetical protein [Hymenobacter cellulosivorans]|uniref:M20/M25/M40 family metallo-hydrolase n=1 Tax=Hymenobacter cellulosivorans TaxID=2932249 RepID=A0ABY4F4N3_9BACT|nr:hypothetical protein [Hymenobacter cellulosivorans]UOQ51424.1 hypothetical protein MUN80_16840 [Hymenobacter cellulosivorans]
MNAAFLSDLQELVRFPSVSTDPRCADAVRACAAWLARHLRGLGLDGVQVYSTPGHPIVYAEKLVSSRLPTLLIYGHYDVQPAAPKPPGPCRPSPG